MHLQVSLLRVSDADIMHVLAQLPHTHAHTHTLVHTHTHVHARAL